jgi:hypothetical protein
MSSSLVTVVVALGASLNTSDFDFLRCAPLDERKFNHPPLRPTPTAARDVVWKVLGNDGDKMACTGLPKLAPTGSAFCAHATCMVLRIARSMGVDAHVSLHDPANQLFHGHFATRHIANEVLFALCGEPRVLNGGKCLQLGAAAIESHDIGVRVLGVDLMARLVQAVASFKSVDGTPPQHHDRIALAEMASRLDHWQPGTRWMAVKGVERFSHLLRTAHDHAEPPHPSPPPPSPAPSPQDGSLLGRILDRLQDDMGFPAIGIAALDAVHAVARASPELVAPAMSGLVAGLVGPPGGHRYNEFRTPDGQVARVYAMADLTRLLCLHAMGRIGHEASAEDMSAAMGQVEALALGRGAQPTVRAVALLTIGLLPRAASRGIEALEAARDDPESLVRCASRKALHLLDPESHRFDEASAPECAVDTEAEAAAYQLEGRDVKSEMEHVVQRPNATMRRLALGPPSEEATRLCLLYMGDRPAHEELRGDPGRELFHEGLSQRRRWQAYLTLPLVATSAPSVDLVKQGALAMLGSEGDDTGAHMDRYCAAKTIGRFELHRDDRDVIVALGHSLNDRLDVVRLTASELLADAACGGVGGSGDDGGGGGGLRRKYVFRLAVGAALEQLQNPEASARFAASVVLRDVARRCVGGAVARHVDASLLGQLYQPVHTQEAALLVGSLRAMMLSNDVEGDDGPKEEL